MSEKNRFSSVFGVRDAHNAMVAAAAVQFHVPEVGWSLFFLVPVGCLGSRRFPIVLSFLLQRKQSLLPRRLIDKDRMAGWLTDWLSRTRVAVF